MKPVIFACAVATLLGACGPKPLPLADVKQLQAADGSYGQDIFGKRRAAGEPVPTMRGNQLLEVRTYNVEDGSFGNEVAGTEIAGAECQVRAEDAATNVRTPGAVHVPLYGYRTPAISVVCTREGYANAITPIRTYNRTQAERAAAGSQGGLIGVLVTAAINAASDETNDVFNYVQPRILLRPGTPEPLPELLQPAVVETAETTTQ